MFPIDLLFMRRVFAQILFHWPIGDLLNPDSTVHPSVRHSVRHKNHRRRLQFVTFSRICGLVLTILVFLLLSQSRVSRHQFWVTALPSSQSESADASALLLAATASREKNVWDLPWLWKGEVYPRIPGVQGGARQSQLGMSYCLSVGLKIGCESKLFGSSKGRRIIIQTACRYISYFGLTKKTSSLERRKKCREKARLT